MTNEEQNDYIKKLGTQMFELIINASKDILPNKMTVQNFQTINFMSLSLVICNFVMFVNDLSEKSFPHLLDNQNSLKNIMDCSKEMLFDIEEMKNAKEKKQ